MTNRWGRMAMNLALPAAVAISAAGARSQTGAAAGRALDVAGVSIGMSAPEAEARLRRAGWTVSRGEGLSWRAAVDAEIARQKGSNAMTRETSGDGDVRASKGDERIGTEVRPSPGGGVLQTVSYSAPLAGRSVVEIGRSLFARYGASSRGRAGPTGLFLTWCLPATCGPDADRLTADTGGSENRLKLNLSWSSSRHLAYDRMVAEAVRTRIGGGRPSF